MFVQVIQGQVGDAAALRAAIDRWQADVRPGAMGWLGSTGGVTDDGRFIALVRFESAEAAAQNSNRPEQDQWWKETSELFTGEATFHDSEDVWVDTPGDPDRAGFVQVMQGRGSDPARARELMDQQDDASFAAFRPEILGNLGAGYGDGEFTMAIYFTTEAEAREGEKKELPPQLAEQMDEMNKLMIGVPEFFDLRDPWLHSPG